MESIAASSRSAVQSPVLPLPGHADADRVGDKVPRVVKEVVRIDDRVGVYGFSQVEYAELFEVFHRRKT